MDYHVIKKKKKIMKYIKKFNESLEDKDSWWNKNYKRLMDVIEDLPYEEWKGLIKHPEDFEGVYNSTNKHRALYLLDTYSIEELEEMIDTYTVDCVS